ncbi:MAG: c-type cytochrome [Alphaproteobacteria bacterium]
MRPWIITGGVVAGVFVAIAAFISFGAYDFAADKPHSRMMTSLIAYARDRAIEVRASDIKAPDLSDAELVRTGAVQYAEMCTGCHLAPGMKDTEMRLGMNPEPPELTQVKRGPAEQFWIVKHGIKMTGMPAWGPTHSDDVIWAIVAFLQKLPDLSTEEYRKLTEGEAETRGHDDQDHGHHEH